MAVPLYRIVTHTRDPRDRPNYLHTYMDAAHDSMVWTWTPRPEDANSFPRDQALRYAKHIRRSWKVPARVEEAS